MLDPDLNFEPLTLSQLGVTQSAADSALGSGLSFSLGGGSSLGDRDDPKNRRQRVRDRRKAEREQERSDRKKAADDKRESRRFLREWEEWTGQDKSEARSEVLRRAGFDDLADDAEDREREKDRQKTRSRVDDSPELDGDLQDEELIPVEPMPGTSDRAKDCCCDEA